uniref:CRISPR-associated endonuclease Cas2 n=1 Tax=Strongyloides papillosus TaxID=174720 RepID=A0A0N5B935_STREA
MGEVALFERTVPSLLFNWISLLKKLNKPTNYTCGVNLANPNTGPGNNQKIRWCYIVMDQKRFKNFYFNQRFYYFERQNKTESIKKLFGIWQIFGKLPEIKLLAYGLISEAPRIEDILRIYTAETD